MMKRLFITLAAFFILALTVSAQQPVGTFSITPKVGVNMSKFSNGLPAMIHYYIAPYYTIPTTNALTEVKPEDYPKSATFMFNDIESKVGFTVGAEGQYQFTSVFGLSLGVFYTQKGAIYKTKGFSNENDGVRLEIQNDMITRLNCITIPVLANMYVWKGLALKAGIQPEIAVSKKAKVDGTISYVKEAAMGVGLDPNVKSFSLSIPVGVSYEYRNFVTDLRYCFGITDLRKDKNIWINKESEASFNRVLSFTVGYKFQL